MIIYYIIGAIGGLAVLFLIAALIGSGVKKSQEKHKNLVETADTRYTFEEKVTTNEEGAKITYNKGDMVLNMGVTYKVSPEEGYIKPGKYTLLATEESSDTFNIRAGSYVKEYKHGQDIVLAKDSEITAISCSVIIR